ncbi:MAG: TetR/AcrR family transcriptional regulator [Chloroflexota bacterium]
MARPRAFDEDKVLNRAMHLFWEKGYEATSIQDLEANIGVGRRSLYNTFGSKHALFLAALGKYTQSSDGPSFEKVCESHSAVDTIRSIFENLADDSLADQTRCGCFMVNSAVELAGQDEDVSKFSESAVQALTNGFYKLVRDGQISKEIPIEKDPVALAQYLTNTYLGFRVMAKMSPNKDAFSNIVNVTMQTLR